jgi:hypothetical protein
LGYFLGYFFSQTHLVTLAWRPILTYRRISPIDLTNHFLPLNNGLLTFSADCAKTSLGVAGHELEGVGVGRQAVRPSRRQS